MQSASMLPLSYSFAIIFFKADFHCFDKNISCKYGLICCYYTTLILSFYGDITSALKVQKQNEKDEEGPFLI